MRPFENRRRVSACRCGWAAVWGAGVLSGGPRGQTKKPCKAPSLPCQDSVVLPLLHPQHSFWPGIKSNWFRDTAVRGRLARSQARSAACPLKLGGWAQSIGRGHWGPQDFVGQPFLSPSCDRQLDQAQDHNKDRAVHHPFVIGKAFLRGKGACQNASHFAKASHQTFFAVQGYGRLLPGRHPSHSQGPFHIFREQTTTTGLCFGWNHTADPPHVLIDHALDTNP